MKDLQFVFKGTSETSTRLGCGMPMKFNNETGAFEKPEDKARRTERYRRLWQEQQERRDTWRKRAGWLG